MNVNETSPVFELEGSDSYEDGSLAKYLVTKVSRKENAELIINAACCNNASAVRIIRILSTIASEANETAIRLLWTLR